jgi:thioredoxin 1
MVSEAYDPDERRRPQVSRQRNFQTIPQGIVIVLYFLKYPSREGEPHMAGGVTDVTDNNFQAEVVESDVPVLVDFWAPWCGPCRRVSPVVEEIATERGEALKVVKLNIDENQQTAMKFNVMSIPTLMLFKHGEVAKTVVGAYPKRKIEQELEPALA